MKSVIERNLGFMGYPDYSVDTEGNVYSHKFYGKLTFLLYNINEGILLFLLFMLFGLLRCETQQSFFCIFFFNLIIFANLPIFIYK